MIDFRPINQMLIDNVHGVFSVLDMQALETGCKRLKPGDVYVEVGVYYGRSTYVAAQLLDPRVEIYAVDKQDPGAGPDTISRSDFWKKTGLDKRVTYITKPSVEAAAEWPDKLIDMMFIDADHSYEGVKADVEAWGPFVKTGGYIYFHDMDNLSPDVGKLIKEIATSELYTDLVQYKDVFDSATSVASVRKI